MTEITRDDFESVTLLTIDEYENSKALISHSKSWWWLRSPGAYNNAAAYVFIDGDVYPDGFLVNKAAGVRPAFKLEFMKASELNPGDKVQIGKYTATVLYDDMLLLDSFVTKHVFDEESNVWRKSAIKKYIESEEFLSLIFD